ncbi:AfsR/SARP family transcriptional regulator [Kribbella sp. CA-293567]|uniref:AfsR/SARP family transcriptional regulator n=1 Tax=Kribbella sp. CA-293567 TaxID=3002436 RepID=UPI0022DDC8B3|nr:AfsR/SARP family transcriptional regulator [Kribbella sp. CA-293567]WBQ08274.1 BTAD domain-containing putative transcriptional regulator [Kribbella sp. CA-293567]
MIRFQLLGPIEVTRNGQRLALGGSKIQTVLATLLLSRNRVVSDSTVSEMLWRGELPSTSNAQIQTYVSRLRSQLGPQVELVRQRGGYLLRAPEAWVDLDEFQAHSATGHAALEADRYADAVTSLRAAQALWRGHALVGATEYLTEVEQPRLEEARLAAGEALMTAELACGNHYRVVSELTAMVSRHPLRENVRGLSMLALYRCGRQAEALATYDACRRHLAEELGIDPRDELKALRQAILEQDPALTAPEPVEVTSRPSGEPPAQLPSAPSDFTGRAKEVPQLDAVLRPGGATTAVVGLAGTGKTALALQIAHAVRDKFPDGQLYLDLAGSTADPVLPATAFATLLRSLGVPEGELPTDLAGRGRLFRQLAAERRLLIVLDDVADESQVRPLLPGGRRTSVLMTSRRRLAALEGTTRTVLRGFTATEAESLLLALSGRADPVATRKLLAATGRLPLAVRVLGARLAANPDLTVPQVAARLSDEPFGQLRLGDLDVGARIETSYAQLSPVRRRALRLLSLGLTGTFSIWQAAVLLNDSLVTAHELLNELADQHLAEVTGDRLDLYSIHPLVRAYARDRAFAEDAPHERSAALERIHQGSRLWSPAA